MPNIPYGFPAPDRLTSHFATFTRPRRDARPVPFPRLRARARRTAGVRTRARPAAGLQVLAAGRFGAAGAGGATEPHRGAALHALPRLDQGQEDRGPDRRAAVERHHRRRAAELRSAVRRDQQPTPQRGAPHVHTRGDPPPDRAGRDRRILQERPGRDALRGQAARRELRPQGADHGRRDAQPDDEREPGHGEHAFHADRGRPNHLGGRCTFRIVRRRRRLADGAHPRQRAGGRGGRHAVFGLLPHCGRCTPKAERSSITRSYRRRTRRTLP